MAYPLPYGEYLGEVEALHLILAHDLYSELRSLIAHVQVCFITNSEEPYNLNTTVVQKSFLTH